MIAHVQGVQRKKIDGSSGWLQKVCRCIVVLAKPFFATAINDNWWNYEAGDRHAA
jgi:hypothetical protein